LAFGLATAVVGVAVDNPAQTILYYQAGLGLTEANLDGTSPTLLYDEGTEPWTIGTEPGPIRLLGGV